MKKGSCGFDPNIDTFAQAGCEKCLTENGRISKSILEEYRPRWMVVCSICGNKRCPHATDCTLECTQSNEPGQKGSSWENYPPPIGYSSWADAREDRARSQREGEEKLKITSFDPGL